MGGHVATHRLWKSTVLASFLMSKCCRYPVVDSVCNGGCGQSLKAWFEDVRLAREGHTISDALPMLRGDRYWAGYNSTF